MNKQICNVCNYTTNNKNSFATHLTSEKHKNNERNYMNKLRREKSKNIVCILDINNNLDTVDKQNKFNNTNEMNINIDKVKITEEKLEKLSIDKDKMEQYYKNELQKKDDIIKSLIDEIATNNAANKATLDIIQSLIKK